jgi:hypothetical protein
MRRLPAEFSTDVTLVHVCVCVCVCIYIYTHLYLLNEIINALLNQRHE